MNRTDVTARLRELSIYNDFYYRKELKLLSQVLKEYEKLNCVLTGVHEGNRKMVAVTDSRILILLSALGGGDVKVIRRHAVSEYRFEKKLFFSTLTLKTEGGQSFVFTNTQGHLKELFEWAMKKPFPES